MDEIVLAGEPMIPVRLRRGAGRRLTLRVSGLDGRVTLSLPRGASRRAALRFLDDKEAWLRRQIAAAPVPARAAFDALLPVEGRARRIRPHEARSVRLTAQELLAPPDPARLGPRLAVFLKALARRRLLAASERHAAALERPFAALTLRDTRSRWGSCTHDGRLMYSWRLILAPPEVLDYVAAHEVAHLAEMNHSPAFWAQVARLMPGYEAPRAWLRVNGAALHAWRFDGGAVGLEPRD